MRGLGARIVIGAIIATLVGGACVVLIAQRLRAAVRQERADIERHLPKRDGAAHRACLADPARWQTVSDKLQIDAFDIDQGEPHHPQAASIDAALLARLRAGEHQPTVMYSDRPWGGATMERLAPSGPCSAVQVVWHHDADRRKVALSRVSLLFALAMGLSVLGAGFIGVRPLVQRIRRLRDAAARVGEPGAAIDVDDGPQDALGDLSRALQQAHTSIVASAEQLAARTTALEEHLTAVAHDLRTPIASLQLTLERAHDLAAVSELSETIARALDDVVYLSALADNLRLAAQLRQDVAQPQTEVDLCALVERVARRFAELGRRRAIRVDHAVPDEPLVVCGDATGIEQAIANVVHNSVAHHDKGGQVAIVLEPAREQDARGWAIRVSDDGPGVAPSALPRLHERHFRTDEARSRKDEGFGLGLAIAHEVCTRAGWRLEITGNDPRGLIVTIYGSGTSQTP